jgi:hypothetical protein
VYLYFLKHAKALLLPQVFSHEITWIYDGEKNVAQLKTLSKQHKYILEWHIFPKLSFC